MTSDRFVILPSIDSTNNHAMRELRSGRAQDGMVYFAMEQTQGKGQREKKWISNPGENIMMSMVWDPSGLDLKAQSLVSFTAALACHDLFAHHAGDMTSIKWPNDLYWRDRKAGGILIENIIKGSKWEHAIIGMGININQVSFDAVGNKAVSLRQITGMTWDVLSLASALIDRLRLRLGQLLSGMDNELLGLYNGLLFRKGEETLFRSNHSLFKGKVLGVNESGHLLVEENGLTKSFSLGQIEWIL